MKQMGCLLACSAVLLASCGERETAAEIAEDKMEAAAEASAASAGNAIAALGLTEAQLLDADLRSSDGTEIGDVAQIRRDGSGQIDRLLIEVEDSNPDRYVLVPIAGLKTIKQGMNTDLSTSMSRAQLLALPEEKLPSP